MRVPVSSRHPCRAHQFRLLICLETLQNSQLHCNQSSVDSTRTGFKLVDTFVNFVYSALRRLEWVAYIKSIYSVVFVLLFHHASTLVLMIACLIAYMVAHERLQVSIAFVTYVQGVFAYDR